MSVARCDVAHIGRLQPWVAGIAAVLAVAAADAVAATRQASKPKPDRIDIAYVEPKSPNNQPVYRLIKERQALEKLRDLLRPLLLPHRLLLQPKNGKEKSNPCPDE